MSRKTIPRETEKPKKLTRAQKKEIDAVIRKYKGDGKPRTAQATIPYEAIYPDGVCRIDRRTFSKCIAFEDISYQLAQPEARTAIFEHLCDLYNYVDASIHVQLSFLNRKVDPVQYAKSFEIAPQGDDFDDIRAEYTAILQKQLASGNNGIVKTKYLTFTIEADGLKTARSRLTRIGLDLLGYFKTMGCVAHVMDGQERLEVLHGIFHPDGELFRFEWDWLAPSGLSTKDFVAPSSLCFGTAKTFGLGGKYGAVSFLQILAPELSDEMLADFLKTESGILVNLHVQAIDQTEAIKTIKRKITDLDAMKIQEQKKAVRSGYDMDILPSDLATYGEDAKKLLNKLQTRNERLFMLTFLVLNVADTKQKLGNDVFQAAGVAQKYNCSLVRLDYQQEQGLVSSLPLGIKMLREAARSDQPEDKLLLWLSRPSGTFCFRERDVLLKDTQAYNTWKFCGEQTHDRILAYAVELTGAANGTVQGNLYELDYQQHFQHIRDAALPVGANRLIYESGMREIGPKEHFDSRSDKYFGEFVRYEMQPRDPELLQAAIRQEQRSREPARPGDFKEHLAALHTGLIEAEAQRIVADMKHLAAPNSPDKNHFMVEVSPYFTKLASSRDTDQLLAMLPYESLHLSSVKDRFGIYAMIDKNENRDKGICKPRASVRKQLSETKQAASPKKAAARSKKHEMEV